MKRFDEAIDRIRVLECPTGDLENRVTEILESYGVADRNKVCIIRDEHFDKGEAQAYRVEILGYDQPVIIFAQSGYDDYVEKVMDVTNES
ncbi:MAG: hypothetical protein LIR50_00005 [Bacillota bacterium]|nr:hypothetical protein [Bacillota bacterium]